MAAEEQVGLRAGRACFGRKAVAILVKADPRTLPSGLLGISCLDNSAGLKETI
ncbi:hypothetical protein [Falsiroseomonas tokyonensis]|uniref:hypothetical protein n=1 Tax=Falsiroseomonas tokyonensis TaxID=430521 RepID=UPI001C20B5B8|nr:hypothetical protein [Falsiroseomonas tokyonensis]